MHPHPTAYRNWIVGAAVLVGSSGFLVCARARAGGDAEESAATRMPRSFSLPIIDLAGDDHRRVIVDREPGQYLGHPSTVLLADGKTILAVYPKGHGRGALVYKRSTDGGTTWSDRLPVPENWATSKEVPTLHRLRDPAGVERLILFSGLYPIRRAVSEDDGVTWSPLEPIGEFGGIVAMGDVVRLRSGTYMALFHDDGRFFGKGGTRSSFTVYRTLSTDGGLSWSFPEVVTRHPHAQLCEPGVIRSPDGSELACLLRENSRRYNSFVIFSRDEGETWTPPVELPAALTGDRHTLRYAPDGRIVAVFRDMAHESPTRGDFVLWVGTYEDIARGREGQYRVRLLDNRSAPGDTGYAGLELLPDRTFVATTYCVLEEGQKPLIVCVRFTMDELDARGGDPYQIGVFISGMEGYHTFRIPSLTVTPKGTLLAICEGRKSGRSDHGDLDLVQKRSTDGGTTWGPLELIYEEGGTEKITIGNPCPVVDRDTGAIWLPFCRDNDDVLLTSSTDDGATWAKPRDITKDVKKDGWGWYATGPGVGIQLARGTHRGRLVIPCDHRETVDGEPTKFSHVFYSDDHGASWQLGASVDLHTDECQVVELEDGRLMINMRNYWGRTAKIVERGGMRAVAWSGDGGVSWSKLRFEKALPEPVCQASFLRYSWKMDGGRSRLLFSNPPSDARRENLTVRLSYDEGETWPIAKRLYTGPSAYSSLAVLPDGRIGCLYESGRRSAYEWIRFVRFSLSWLTDGQDEP